MNLRKVGFMVPLSAVHVSKSHLQLYPRLPEVKHQIAELPRDSWCNSTFRVNDWA